MSCEKGLGKKKATEIKEDKKIIAPVDVRKSSTRGFHCQHLGQDADLSHFRTRHGGSCSGCREQILLNSISGIPACVCGEWVHVSFIGLQWCVGLF